MPQPFDTRRISLALSLAGLCALAACNGSSGSSDEPPAPAIPDPQAGYQWYLDNTGQDVLAGTRPTPGVDLNMGTLFADGIRGKGVVVAVVDDGLDLEHEDLAANADSSGSINLWQCSNPVDLNSCASGPLLDPRYPDNAHGTGVGGLIGMVAMNGKGGRGIAPEVRLKGFNLLNDHGNSGTPTVQDELHYNLFVLGDGNQRASDVQVFNMSYGSEDISMPGSDDDGALDSYERVLAKTRGGKGGLYIKAAGNEFIHSRSYPKADCKLARKLNVGCFDAATDPESSLSAVVLAAAVNSDGQRSSYSSEGAPVWVAGFGGEYNGDPQYDPDAEGPGMEPAMFSTDWSGCQVGTHRAGQEPANAIDNGTASIIDPECKYTASFNGTSAATPTVAAVTALVLQARPELKARDVHYILAKSARHPGNWRQGLLNHPARKATLGRTFDAGWHTNARGVAFSRWFGYGLVDAQAAVALAKTFQPLPAAISIEQETTATGPTPIRYAGDQAVAPQDSSLAISINQDVTVERVLIAFETTHTKPSQLLVTLRSPSGTVIPVLVPYTSLKDTANGFEVGILGVNGFLDESARGEWRLSVEDISQTRGSDDQNDPADLPQLSTFALRILGHAPTAP